MPTELLLSSSTCQPDLANSHSLEILFISRKHATWSHPNLHVHAVTCLTTCTFQWQFIHSAHATCDTSFPPHTVHHYYNHSYYRNTPQLLDLENQEWWVKNRLMACQLSPPIQHLYQFSQPPFILKKKAVKVILQFSWLFLISRPSKLHLNSKSKQVATPLGMHALHKRTMLRRLFTEACCSTRHAVQQGMLVSHLQGPGKIPQRNNVHFLIYCSI